MEAAVLTWPRKDGDALLLGTDGSWRSVPDTDGAVDGALVRIDLPTGERTLLEWPADLERPWDYPPAVLWGAGDAELIVATRDRMWSVAPDGTFSAGVEDGRFVVRAHLPWERPAP